MESNVNALVAEFQELLRCKIISTFLNITEPEKLKVLKVVRNWFQSLPILGRGSILVDFATDFKDFKGFIICLRYQ